MSDEGEVPSIRHATYIKSAPERVYQTLTTSEGWDAWFTQGTSIDPRPNGKIILRWKDFAAEHWTMEDGGPVLAAEPNRKFVFQWSPGKAPTTVTILLKQLGEGTRVELTESGYTTEDDPVTLVNCAAGWGEALTLLKFYLEHGITYGQVPSEEK